MKQVPEIKDRYVINDGVFYLLGIMVVVPFEFYINSLDFWMYKLKPPPQGSASRPTHPTPPTPSGLPRPPGPINLHGMTDSYIIKKLINYNSSYEYSLLEENETWDSVVTTRLFPFDNRLASNANDTTLPDERTAIQVNFIAGFNITFKVALLGALLICSFWSHKLTSPEKRLKWSLFALCILFLFNTVATQINSRKMINWFFAGAMIFATIMNFCTGMAFASLYELISKFPPSYYGSIQSGHNICGIISAFLQVSLLSARLPPNQHTAIYFACGTTILLATTVYYCYTIKNSKYFIYKIGQNESQNHAKVHVAVPAPRTPICELILKIKWYYATLAFIDGTTHIVYPGLAILVVPFDRDSGNHDWKEVYFVPVITCLGFQISNLIGRETARIIKTPKHEIVLFILAVLRITFIPLLIFCNALPRNRLPVLFHDNEFICILSIFAFSEGILYNLAIVDLPTTLEKSEREAVMVLVPLLNSVTVILASSLNVFVNNLL